MFAVRKMTAAQRQSVSSAVEDVTRRVAEIAAAHELAKTSADLERIVSEFTLGATPLDS